MLAVTAYPASASTMVQNVGDTQVLLSLNPDPPSVGTVHARIQLKGRDARAKTEVTFTSAMPGMQMNGASGTARVLTNGLYEFDLPLAMASEWTLDLHFKGGVTGSAHFQFAVVGGSAPSSAMPGMSSGNVDAWRTAFFALIVVIIIGYFVLRRDRRATTAWLFAVALGVVVLFAVLQSRFAAPSMDMASMSAVQGTGATPVTLAAVRIGFGGSEVSAPATVLPYLSQDISARASGVVSNMSAYVGDHVAAGQVLATLEAPELGSQAAAAAADASAQAAAARAAEIEAHHHAPLGVSIARNDAVSTRTELSAAVSDQRAKAQQYSYWSNEISREESLYKQGAVSTQELQDERAQAAAAQAAYRGASEHVSAMRQQVQASQSRAMDAEANVAMAQDAAQSAQAQASRAANNAQAADILAGYRAVVAPSAAVVTKRLVDPGVYVQVGTPILRLAVIERLRIQANVSQRDIASIHVGTPFEATTASGSITRGRVSAVSPAADPVTHTAMVEAIIDGAGSNVSPGDYLRVRFHAGANNGSGISVPSAAIVGGGSNAGVWTDLAGSAHRVPVTILRDDGTTAVVRARLNNGDRVVVDGAATLEEGQSIAEQRG